MKKLKDLLYKAELKLVSGSVDLEIEAVEFDSRKVSSNCLFVAISGSVVDGHEFIEQAISQGAKAIVCEVMPEEKQEDITYIVVEDSNKALAVIASNLYDNPSTKIKLVGVTGTNGKQQSLRYYMTYLEI